jgi:hypothetical protein
VIKNGKGEVIAQSVPDRYGDFSANPPLSAFDGTFVIETKRNDGSTETQRVTYPPGQPVKLKRDPETGRYVAEAPPKRYAHPQVTGELGAMSLDRPDAKLFRREDGVIIRGAAIKQSNSDDGSYGSVGVDLPLDLFGLAAKGTRTFISLRGGYGESTSSSVIFQRTATSSASSRRATASSPGRTCARHSIQANTRRNSAASACASSTRSTAPI